MADDAAAPTGPSGMNLGKIVSEKIADQVKNMDVMTIIKKMIAAAPDDQESAEVRDKLKGVIDQFNAMNEEDKATFTAKVKEGLASKLSAKLADPDKNYLGGLEEAIQSAVMNQLYIAAAVVVVVIILVVFFGYKLYKSIKDKEVKKEEKKKLKQMKKKK